MFNNNTVNEGYKTLSPEAQKDKKQVKKYKELQKSVELDEKYVSFPDAEDMEYFHKVEETYYKKHPEDLELFEAEGWWGLSPFEWTKEIRLGGLGKIFAPIKWLAGLCMAGIALLLAALYKALKEGNKQLAILKVRKWIESLVVIADGGYKKQRKSKDSLFLIEARARRDILQAAVVAGYAAGIDIPTKTNEPPMGIESAKNESLVLDGMDSFLNEDSKIPGSDFMNMPDQQPENQSENQQNNIAQQDTYKYNNKLYYDWQQVEQAIQQDVQNGVLPNRESAQVGLCYKGTSLSEFQTVPIKNQQTPSTNTSGSQGGMDAVVNNPNQQDPSTGKPYNDDLDLNEIGVWCLREQNGGLSQDYPNTPEGIVKMFKDISANYLKDTSQRVNPKDPTSLAKGLGMIAVYYKRADQPNMAPAGPLDDNQKMILIKEIQNIEANAAEEMKQKLNQSYDINTLLPDDSQVDWSLMKTLKTSKWFGLVKHKTDLWAEAKSSYKMQISDVTDESQRQQYVTNILTNVNAALTKITTPAIAKNYANVINQFNQQMMQRTQTSNDRIPNTGQAASTGNLRVGNHGTNESIDTSKYPMFADDVKMFEAGPNTGGFDFNDMLRAGYEYTYGRNQNYEIDYDKTRNLIDNTFKASQNIFTSASVNEFLIFTKTRDQMNNFLNELTKSVHLIIDSVAKKAQQQGGGGNDSAGKAVMNFLTNDSGDPKQNRSLKNLWDNIARPKLDSRAITRLFEITSSPEFVYFIQMLTKTIPMCVMTLYMENDDASNKCMALIDKHGQTLSPLDALKAQADKNLTAAKGGEKPAEKINMDDSNNGNQNADQDKVNQQAQAAVANQQQPQAQPQNSSVQYTMSDYLNEKFS